MPQSTLRCRCRSTIQKTGPARRQDRCRESCRHQGRERGPEIHLLPGILAFAGHVAGLAAVVAGGIAPAKVATAAAAILGQRRQQEAPSVRCFGEAQETLAAFGWVTGP